MKIGYLYTSKIESNYENLLHFMKSAICAISVLPVRREPREQSELETQILFGEVFHILEEIPNWCRVRADYDDYEGWVDEKMVFPCTTREAELWLSAPGIVVSTPSLRLIREPQKSMQTISAGSRIVFNGEDRNSFVIAGREFYLQNDLSDKKIEITEVAKGFLNAPYLWGGRNFFGIDCSGFTQIVYKIMGIKLPRNSSQQIEYGAMVSFVEEAKIGDLAFFDNEEGDIVHVGICLGNGEIIHASGEVKIDLLDHLGIFDNKQKKYTHKLRVIKRIIQ